MPGFEDYKPKKRSRKGFGRGKKSDEKRFSKHSPKKGRRDLPPVKAKCDSCGKICELPFKPTEGKPVFCDACFGKEPVRQAKSNNSQSTDLELINKKLDKIMKALKIK